MAINDRQAAGTTSRMEAKAVELLNHDLRYSSLRLVKKKQRIRDLDGNLREFSQNKLAISTDFHTSGGNASRKLVGTLCWLTAAVFITLTFIKFLCLGILHYHYDYISTRLWPTSYYSNSSVAKCMTSSQNESFIRNNLDSYGEFIRLERALFSLDAMVPSMLGFNSIANNLLCSGIFYPLFFGLVAVKILRPSFHVYDLVSNRHEERYRFKCEMNSICKKLFSCKRLEFNGRWVYEYGPRNRIKPTRPFCHPAAKSIAGGQYAGPNRKFANIALKADRELVHLVEPAHLSDWFYGKIMAYINWKLFIRWWLFMVPSCVFVAMTMSIEFKNRVAYRLDLIECQSINGTPTRAPIRLANIESNAYYMTAYRNYDQTSLVSFLNLVLIEARLHVTPGILLTLMEFPLAMYFLALLATFFAELYAYEYSSKMCWLVQIEGQLEQCLWDLKQVIKSSRLKLALEEVDRQRNECLKSLTLAYLNFELFRRQQKEYQLVTNFVFAEMSLFQIQSLIVSYICCVNIKSYYTKLSLVFATYIFFVLNAFLITGSIRTAKALELMNNISRIVALSAKSSLNQAPIIYHWFNQMLDRNETKNWFAPNFLGIYVSYDKIITMNAYLVLLWYILW